MSIRLYIFAVLTGLVLVIATVLSYQSASIFLGSFDVIMEDIMYDIGENYPQEGNVEQQVIGYHVTTDWQLVPAQVRAQFPNVPSQENVRYSKFVDWIYIAPPKKAYSLMMVKRDGKQIFISRFDEDVHGTFAQDDHQHLIDPMVVIILVGLAGLTLFVITLLYIFKKIAAPVEALRAWARRLSIKELDKPIPEFQYKELNDLALLMRENMVSVAETIAREQAFLSYASHELRTPIAVIRSNAALLEKVNPNPTDKEQKIRERISRASLTMKSMTETLLWLSREGETEMPIEQVRLDELIETIQTELAYLLAGKQVSVEVNTGSTAMMLAKTPCIIVLSNLIRNAYQHTQHGHVHIIQQQHIVQVVNHESDATSPVTSSNPQSLGFGLGMQLVEKLTSQFGWKMTVNSNDTSYSVEVRFEN